MDTFILLKNMPAEFLNLVTPINLSQDGKPWNGGNRYRNPINWRQNQKIKAIVYLSHHKDTQLTSCIGSPLRCGMVHFIRTGTSTSKIWSWTSRRGCWCIEPSGAT